MMDPCRIFVEVISELGVGTFVCSPGSRNTPLLAAVASCGEMEGGPEYVTVVDERSAAFVALGIAMASRRPVALVCTSGSAVLNYAPALAEAYYKGVPLIVLSADRPREWIDQEDSQTIRQPGMLAGIVKQSYDYPAYSEGAKEASWYANRLANDAMATALGGKPGPVHINIAVSLPLISDPTTPAPMQRLVSVDYPSADLPKPLMRELADETASRKILVVAGSLLPDDSLSKAMHRLAGCRNVAILAECLSNLRFPGVSGPADVVLTEASRDELDRIHPDLVITIGGALISAKLKQWLRDNPPAQHWSVGHTHNTVDTLRVLTRRIETSPAVFLRQLAGILSRTECPAEAAGYRDAWEAVTIRGRASLEQFAADAPWSQLRAFGILARHLPHAANLFLSNGMCVRYGDMWSLHSHACYGNRGVSGIEGCTSTAIGTALTYGGMTVLVTGDLSMTYDIGALVTRLMPSRMRIIVVDNSGGGIFRFVATTRRQPQRERLWCVDPHLPVRGLAEAFGLKYFEADSEASLEEALPRFFAFSTGAAILRLRVDPETSPSVLISFLKRNRK